MTIHKPLSRPRIADRAHSLKDHLLAVGQQTTDRLPEDYKRLGAIAGWLHDLGKLHPNIQTAFEKLSRGEKSERLPPHAIYGAMLFPDILELALPIAGHHRGLYDVSNSGERPCFTQICDRFFSSPGEVALLETMKTWANQELDPLTPPTHEGSLSREMATRMIFSALVDSDRLDVARFEGQQVDFTYPAIELLCHQITSFQERLIATAEPTPTNRVRAEIYREALQQARSPRGFFRLTAPTGGGKTLTMLSAALEHCNRHQMDGVIIVPPLTTIIEQSAQVYRDILGDAVLEVHSNFDQDSLEHYKQNTYKILSQRWDSPVVVSSSVQFFESLFANHPRKCRKVHQYQNRVIILDEVQSLPIGLLDPILFALRQLVEEWGCSVFLCSATQPAFEKLPGFKTGIQGLIPTEFVKNHFQTLQRVDYEFLPDPLTWEAIADMASGFKNAVFVVNTKADAARGFLTLRDRFGEDCLYHLSTTMCMAHRRLVLAEVKAKLIRGSRVYLVSTQIIEAGVDVDFEYGFRQWAGLDAIAQTAGRVNRNGKRSTGTLFVFELEGASKVSKDYQFRINVAKSLGSTNLHDPATFGEYFKRLHGGIRDKRDEFGIQKLRQQWKFEAVANRFKIIEPDGDRVSAIVEFDDQARSLIHSLLEGVKVPFTSLQPYIVSVRHKDCVQVQSIFAQEDSDLVIWQGDYDQALGISAVADPT